MDLSQDQGGTEEVTVGDEITFTQHSLLPRVLVALISIRQQLSSGNGSLTGENFK